VSILVVDASVVIKWFVPEVHGESARRLLTAPHQYLAPDLLFPEVGNVIWKKVRRGELTAREGGMLAADLTSVAVEAVASRVLLSDAVALAMATGLTVYDATYLALAVRLDTVLVTADERLGRAVAPDPVAAAHVRMVQTFAS
jgi:predicted nucleic acid-binding protein